MTTDIYLESGRPKRDIQFSLISGTNAYIENATIINLTGSIQIDTDYINCITITGVNSFFTNSQFNTVSTPAFTGAVIVSLDGNGTMGWDSIITGPDLTNITIQNLVWTNSTGTDAFITNLTVQNLTGNIDLNTDYIKWINATGSSLSTTSNVNLKGSVFNLSQNVGTFTWMGNSTVINQTGTSGQIFMTGFSLNSQATNVITVNNGSVSSNSSILLTPNISLVGGGSAPSGFAISIYSQTTGQYQMAMTNLALLNASTGCIGVNYLIC